ncbi:MBL fold metallo-hydrolase [Salinibacterium sp. GXW1014]|uniref:MBL fold metallo-hydrolase n=1 Tax=Salinibacterium sp. GXW1014 TaxID=3377838 RepID=UPI00383B0028
MTAPVSAAELDAHREGRLPAMERVVEGVWTVPLAIPPGHMPYTLSYLIEDARGGVHLVDPGWDLDENLDALELALGRIGRGWADVASVIVTHLHPDHIGLAGRVRALHGVPVVLHRLEHEAQQRVAALEARPEHVHDELTRWGVPAERFDEVRGYATKGARVIVEGDILVQDGQLLDVPGRRIRALHTPGHTPGHMCLLDEGDGLLFTGDHVLPKVVPGIGLGGPVDYNPLERYLHGMADIARYDGCEALPGHGYRFRGVTARATEIARHHLKRTAEVARLVEHGDPGSTWETASRLTWSRGWENLARHYLIAALRQTELHLELVRGGGHVELLEQWGVGAPVAE